LHAAAGLRSCSDAPPSKRLEATILVRRRPSAAAQERIAQVMRGDAPAIPREQAAEFLGTDPEDLQRVADFAGSVGLTVTESSPQKGTVGVSGTVLQMESAFGIKLLSCEMGGNVYITYEGVLTIPAALDQIVAAVLGLDQRPVARH